MTAPKLTVGQTLWYIPEYRQRPDAGREVTVERIGRAYAYLAKSGLRVCLKTWFVSSPGWTGQGKCYASEAAWRDAVETMEMWRQFCRTVARVDLRPGVTVADISAAAALLKIELPNG